MDIAQNTAKFLGGLQNIERAIIAKVREAGGTITAKNFRWNHGRDFLPPPRDAVDLDISAMRNTFNVQLSYEQVTDSWRRVERPDVAAIVRHAVATLTH